MPTCIILPVLPLQLCKFLLCSRRLLRHRRSCLLLLPLLLLPLVLLLLLPPPLLLCCCVGACAAAVLVLVLLALSHTIPLLRVPKADVAVLREANWYFFFYTYKVYLDIFIYILWDSD